MIDHNMYKCDLLVIVLFIYLLYFVIPPLTWSFLHLLPQLSNSILLFRHVYGVTFIKYTQYRNIGKLNNFKVFLSNTGKTIKLSKIVFIDKMEEKKYHTVRTIPEYPFMIFKLFLYDITTL
jgi:hypothetical protein